MASRPPSLAPGAPRVLCVYKKSAWQTNVLERKSPRFLELLELGHGSVERLEAAHVAHVETLEEVRLALETLGVRATFRFRGDEGLVEGFDLVVTVGGDGTLLWAARWLSEATPVIAINSAPRDSVGHFCAGKKGKVRAILEKALAKELPVTRLPRAHVELDGEVLSRRVLNDALFAHASPAATTRFLLRVEGKKTRQVELKSSGVWAGCTAGSTAAQRSAGGEVLPVRSKKLQWVVREPYWADGKRPPMLRGLVGPEERLVIVSKVRDGRVWVDGPHHVREVRMGSELSLAPTGEPLTILGFPRALAETRGA
jgi:NAD+ kinase